MGQFAASAGAEWAGTPRYGVTRKLGAGGMGVVYEARDAERGHSVALKTLPCFDAAALYRFKQEFRTLADVRHENLVQLFELVVSSEAPAFFAMELVDGVDFTQHVRGAWAQQPRDPNRAEEVATRAGAIRSPAHAEERSESRDRFTMEDYDRRSPADVAKLRPALRQLCEGLCALHATGKLHRDIKPSNVLVTHAGRVVILDFGVATDVAAPSDQDDEVAGTPRYMAPEQAMSEAPTPAGDWYSVGVMLYEALAGRPPFVGTTAEVLKAKCLVPPIPPSALVDGLPRDLDELCVDLLQIEPAARPSGSAILSRLLSASDGAAPATQPVSLAPTAHLVGRDKERVRLEEAFEQVRADRAQTVLVGGAPGVGKSALVHRFVDDLLRCERAAVLFGRAYERESLPYKAVDSVIDALSRRLVRAAEPIELPEDAWALARLFPVLERVPGLSQPPASRLADPQAVRRRAFGALRDILAALATREPLVVFIDDVQWGDTDSVAALLEIVRPPDPPRVLLVMTYRDEAATDSAFLRELRRSWPSGAGLHEMHVGPLGAEDARRLALEVLGSSDALSIRAASGIARESAGSPLLVEELARYGRADAHALLTFGGITLDKMIGERLDALPASARVFAELAAVSGRPLPLRTLAAAAGLPAGMNETSMLLQKQRFVRASLRDGREMIEPVHDRVRETIVALLPPPIARVRHARLATALESMPEPDLEAIAMHTLGAGERARASTYAEAAAEGAASKLAFDQAARLFRMALDTAGADAGDRAQALRVRIAYALQQAGRLSASADAYREAAVGAASLERVQLEGASAGQMLRCGRIEEGIALLGRVLSAIGMSAPKSTIAALFYLVVYRLAAAFVGRVVERDRGDVSTEDRIRLEALDSVAVGMGLVNVLLGACMQARHVLLAFRVGDRHQLLRALGVRLIHFSISSRPLTRKELAMRARARALAEKVGPEGLALYHGAHGILLHLRGQMVASLAEFDAYRSLKSRVIEPNFPIFEVWSLIYAGRLRVAVPTAKRLLREVDQDGDVYTGVCLRCPAMIEISMIEDDPESGWRHLKEAVERWAPPGFTVQHWYVLVFGAHLHLYCGQAEAAYQRIASKMPALKKSLLLHAAPARRHTLYALGRAAIASANGLPASERERRLVEAGRCARALQRMGWPVDRFYAAVLRGALANARGRRDEAVAALRAAVALGDETGPLYAWTAQYQLGRLLGGEEGRALAAAAEEFFAVEGVRAPSRYAAAFVPGEWGPRLEAI